MRSSIAIVATIRGIKADRVSFEEEERRRWRFDDRSMTSRIITLGRSPKGMTREGEQDRWGGGLGGREWRDEGGRGKGRASWDTNMQDKYRLHVEGGK